MTFARTASTLYSKTIQKSLRTAGSWKQQFTAVRFFFVYPSHYKEGRAAEAHIKFGDITSSQAPSSQSFHDHASASYEPLHSMPVTAQSNGERKLCTPKPGVSGRSRGVGHASNTCHYATERATILPHLWPSGAQTSWRTSPRHSQQRLFSQVGHVLSLLLSLQGE